MTRADLHAEGTELLERFEAMSGSTAYVPLLVAWMRRALILLAKKPQPTRSPSLQRQQLRDEVWREVLREVKSRVPHADDCDVLTWERSAWYRHRYPLRPECSCGLDSKWALLDARHG
jgi:hypothetical protein